MVFRKYSRDVKIIVIKMVLCGYSLTSINNETKLEISADSISRWKGLYKQTREVVRDPAFYEPRGRPVAVTRKESDFILAALELEPTLYLDEIQSHLSMISGEQLALSTIHNEMRNRLHLTSKKARTVHPAQCPIQRAEFVSRIGFIPSDHLVFIAGVSIKTHSRDRAWAIQGRQTVRLPCPLVASRISVLPAVSLDGLLAVMAQEGTVCRLDLEYFLDELLLPNMNRFPGRNSVLIMDNARVHHGGNIEQLCEERGVLLIYLPPYSPDMNPIEKVFSVLKSHLKRHNVLTGTCDDPQIIKDLLPHVITPELMAALFRGSNYRT